MSTRLTRPIAWLYAAALVFLTLGSPRYRFETMLPHNVEHLVAFSISGLSFSIGYRSRPLLVPLAGVGFVARPRVPQIWGPGRHGRWVDFAMGALGLSIWVGGGLVGARVSNRRTA